MEVESNFNDSQLLRYSLVKLLADSAKVTHALALGRDISGAIDVIAESSARVLAAPVELDKDWARIPPPSHSVVHLLESLEELNRTVFEISKFLG